MSTRLPALLPRIILFFGPALIALPTSLHADPVTYIAPGSTWLYLPGLAEASTPAPDWREVDFDDDTWTASDAPFGYGDPPLGTDLAALQPPMRSNYLSLFLRKTFDVGDAGRVDSLEVDVNYDDGFILWINGVELIRPNMPGNVGDPVAYDDTANRAFKSNVFVNFPLPDPSSYLVDGRNVVAVMVFNNQINSSDLKLDMELFDPDGVDVTPPGVEALAPGAGATVRSLEEIQVTFSEFVLGVDAVDLRVDGAPAISVTGSDSGPYTFVLPPLADGEVRVEWAPKHGIVDRSEPPNSFSGGSWIYTIDPAAPAADLVINEIVAANRSGLVDEDGETVDWLEIRNRGTEPVEIGGYSLSDDPDSPGKFVLPSRTIAPDGYLLVFTSGKGRRPARGEIHATFRLDSDGEFLGLYSPDAPRIQVSAHAPEYPAQRPDVAFGLDGAGRHTYLATPTPGAANAVASARDGIVADPLFSFERGFYEAPFDLELTTLTSGASVRFTTDGSKPSPTHGTIHDGAIPIRGTSSRAVTTIRAIAYRDGYLPSRVKTHTYVFMGHVLRQPSSPSGFPNRWGGASVDYGMDPDVVNNPRYAQRVTEGLLAIPSMSIVTDVSSIFGPGGIYSNPTGTGVAWERECSAEIFYPPGFEPPEGSHSGRQINCGVRMQGGASRNPSRSPKHSFRLVFKGIYGPTKLRYRLFPESTATSSFDTITLRAGYNNSWIHSNGDQRRRAQYNRDQWIRDVLLDMGQVSSHGIFVHLYVNGLYWGLYNAVERPSAPFAAAYMGGVKEEYDALNSAQPVDGNGSAWRTLQDRAAANMSSLSSYERVLEMLDPVNLIDYMIANFYGGNQDWDHHNWYAARRRVPGSEWRFFSWDAERILEGVNTNIIGEDNGNQPSRVYSRLRGNTEFRLLIADRLQRHLFVDGSLTPTRSREIWEERAETLEDAVVAESARWGDYRSSSPYTADGHWSPERNRLNSSYFTARSRNVLGYFRSAGLFPSVGAPLFSRPGGEIPPGFELTISRPSGTSGTILYTTDGTDPRRYGSGDVADGALIYSSPLLIGGTVLVKARIRRATTWSPLTEAFFSTPTLHAQLRITEIMYNAVNGDTREFVEIRNVGASAVALAGLRFTAGIDYTFDDHEPLEPGGFHLIAADRESFESAHPGATLDGVYAGSLSDGGERLTIRDPFGTRVLSLEYDDENDWPLAPDGFGYSLVLDDIEGDPDRPTSWRASAGLHGSPGEEDPERTDGRVLVNEVLSRTSAPFEDAIELHNPTGQAVDIGGWFLSDSRGDFTQLMKYRIPDDTVLAPGAFVVFYESQFNRNPGVFPSFALDGAGDQVYLSSADANRDLTGHIVGMSFDGFDSEVSFGRVVTSTGSDTSPLVTHTFGMDDPANVEEFRSGTGLPNDAPLVGPIVIHEIHYHPEGGGDEFLEILNLTDETIGLFGADSLGGDVDRGWRIRGISDAAGVDSFEFPEGASLGPNGLALIVSTSPAAFRLRHGVAEGVPIFGPFGGALANDGESLRLLRPAPADGEEVPYVRVDRVVYGDGFPWPDEADGGGSSLERRIATDYGNEPENWGASVPVDGTPGLANSVGPPLPNQPPLAAFTTVPSTGEAPLEILADASRSEDPDGIIVAWDWDFGDGEGGSGRQISHVYPEAGKYTVRLTVRDDDGAETSSSRTIFVTEPSPNEPPVASFSATPTSGRAPLDVRFDAATSNDTDGSIVSYDWDLADGDVGTGRVLVHRFVNDGIYHVRLTVTDDDGSMDTATVTITVGSPPDNLPPVAEFTADPTQGVQPLQVRFDASESTDPDGSIVDYGWSFDDGGSGTGRILVHRFDDAGEYDVRLTVTDDDNDVSSVTRRITVHVDNTGGGQKPGDCNQDGSVDISDGVCILGHLFLGDPVVLPCDGGTINDTGNITLLDSNGDAGVDLGDAVYLLGFLFQGGLPPALGDDCVRMRGCPEVCVP